MFIDLRPLKDTMRALDDAFTAAGAAPGAAPRTLRQAGTITADRT